MNIIGAAALPVFAAIIVLCGILRDVKVFDCFLSGGKDGFSTAVKLLPVLIGTVIAVSMLSACGILDTVSAFLSPVAACLGLPTEVIPLILLHPFSGSGGTALLISILEKCGPDSYAGTVASVICASSETTFYTIAVYFGSVGIKKIRYTLFSALCADMAAAVISAAAVRLTMS